MNGFERLNPLQNNSKEKPGNTKEVSGEVLRVAKEESRSLRDWMGENKKIAGAMLLMTMLAVGDTAMASETKGNEVTDKNELAEMEKSRTAFAKIEETYKKFNIKNKDEIDAQLKLYEENKKFLTRLPPDQKAEFEHEWAFTKFQQVLNKYGAKESERVYTKNSPEKFKPAELEADIKSLLEVYPGLLQAKNFREHSGERENFDRTVNLTDSMHQLLIDMSAGTPEATIAKKGLLSKIQNALADLNKGEIRGTIEADESKINAPDWVMNLEIKQGERKINSTINLQYDPVSKRAIIASGLSDFDSLELKSFISAINQE